MPPKPDWVSAYWTEDDDAVFAKAEEMSAPGTVATAYLQVPKVKAAYDKFAAMVEDAREKRTQARALSKKIGAWINLLALAENDTETADAEAKIDGLQRELCTIASDRGPMAMRAETVLAEYHAAWDEHDQALKHQERQRVERERAAAQKRELEKKEAEAAKKRSAPVDKGPSKRARESSSEDEGPRPAAPKPVKKARTEEKSTARAVSPIDVDEEKVSSPWSCVGLLTRVVVHELRAQGAPVRPLDQQEGQQEAGVRRLRRGEDQVSRGGQVAVAAVDDRAVSPEGAASAEVPPSRLQARAPGPERAGGGRRRRGG